MLPSFITKQVLQLFGFPYHTAPGEAEAECALLQKSGLVDAVLSEDVDTLMFGSSFLIRNWSSEQIRGNKTPTHVNVYGRQGSTHLLEPDIDSDGMILVALMSGGDYSPAGVSECGIKTACEAARAGFGADLCRLSPNDTSGWSQWKERLNFELQTNESKLFSRKHRALVIPDNFPDFTILRYYTHPTISNSDQLVRLREKINWDARVNITGLRNFVAEAFEWHHLSGAKKFVRGLAPALLVNKLCLRNHSHINTDDLGALESDERALVTAICDKRAHFLTDGSPEIRLAYTPIDVVGLDLEVEEPDTDPIEPYGSDLDEPREANQRSRSQSPTKQTSTYDPTQVEKVWVLESYVKIGVPLLVENWEEDMRDPRKFASRKARERAATGKNKSSGMKPGAMNAFVKTIKPGIDRTQEAVFPQSALDSRDTSRSVHDISPLKVSPVKKPTKATLRKPFSRSKSAASSQDTTTPSSANINPWTLAKRPSDIFDARIGPAVGYSALGILGPSSAPTLPCAAGPLISQAVPDAQTLATPTSRNAHHRRKSDPVSPGIIDLITPPKLSSKSSDAHKPRPTTPDSLPSPSLLSSPSKRCQNRQSPHKVLRPPVGTEIPSQASIQPRALLALRESLDGTWRDIEPWEQKGPYVKTVLTKVDTVDLTML
ncbi:MAG: hypothetical protein Q9220_003178 [cf. Caloplaca sp. 1 TL-2023]